MGSARRHVESPRDFAETGGALLLNADFVIAGYVDSREPLRDEGRFDNHTLREGPESAATVEQGRA